MQISTIKVENLINNDYHNNQQTCNISEEHGLDCNSIINGSEYLYDTTANIDCKNSVKTNYSKTQKPENSFRNLKVLTISRKIVFSCISSIKRFSDKLSSQIFSENKVSENEWISY